MTTVFLVRHGLTAQTGRVLYGRTPGIDLDDRGRAQAEELVRRFEGVRVTAVYSSPLERCVRTVEPLAAARRLDVRTDDGLLEMDAGAWTGKTLRQVRRAKAWDTVQRTPSAFTFPGGGEAFTDAQARAVASIERIARRHRRGAVVVATHGDIVRITLAHLTGTPLDAFQRIVIDTVGVSVVELGGPRPHILLVNDTGGLARFRTAATPPWDADHGRTSPKMRG
jgi:probable phosphomutase (TIGR03848 family)